MNTACPPKVICLTPIKNEAWILDRFLKCAAQWADTIIVADQGSDDGSREIAARHPKAMLIENPSPAYDEGARQRLLLSAARRIPGRKLLIALDADEMLTANRAESAEWGQILQAPEGTVFRFDWVNIRPDFAEAWIPHADIPFGFMDDGSAHQGQAIHSTRLPTPPGSPCLHLKDIKVLHYQYTDWARMASKQRWYQCWERINHPTKRAVTIYRQYHHMEGWPKEEIVPLQPIWLEGYLRQGINMTEVRPQPYYRWDCDILEMFARYGTRHFRKLAIWEADWADLGRKTGISLPAEALQDPRNAFEKRVHHWLKNTQPRSRDPKIRMAQRLLRVLGW